MPGSYAHITLSNVASEKRRLKKIEDFPREAIEAAGLFTNFLELGSISPDYPYLDILSGDSKEWANSMHYTHTCQDIYAAAELVRKIPVGHVQQKCLAWLMGYTSHVVADMCIHPVVELKVGPYKGNETPHRTCEMHQDTYIFERLGVGVPSASGHMKATIMTCHGQNDKNKLDLDIKQLWFETLNKVYKDEFETNPPDLDVWHKRCYMILEKLLPTSSNLVGFSRHIVNNFGFSYPAPSEVNQSFIEELSVPFPIAGKSKLHYDEIFDYAIEKVQLVWLDVCRHALGLGDFITFADQEWNLDTGKNVLAQDQIPIFWEVA